VIISCFNSAQSRFLANTIKTAICTNQQNRPGPITITHQKGGTSKPLPDTPRVQHSTLLVPTRNTEKDSLVIIQQYLQTTNKTPLNKTINGITHNLIRNIKLSLTRNTTVMILLFQQLHQHTATSKALLYTVLAQIFI